MHGILAFILKLSRKALHHPRVLYLNIGMNTPVALESVQRFATKVCTKDWKPGVNPWKSVSYTKSWMVWLSCQLITDPNSHILPDHMAIPFKYHSLIPQAGPGQLCTTCLSIHLSVSFVCLYPDRNSKLSLWLLPNLMVFLWKQHHVEGYYVHLTFHGQNILRAHVQKPNRF